MEKTEGPAFASPSDQCFTLERRDVGSDFHRDGNDLGLGLGPLHGSFLQGVVNRALLARMTLGVPTQPDRRMTRRRPRLRRPRAEFGTIGHILATAWETGG